MGDDSEWLKLPTDEKCQHKAWKARVAGYEEATKLFLTVGDEKSPEFSKYLGLVKKFVVDNNAVALEKGLEATLAYVENAAVAGKAASEVCGGIVAKCLNQRAKTRDLGMAILMMYIEIEKHEIVHEELMKGLTNKQPKIVSACVVALREALRDFGTKIVSVKPILKQLQTLLEDRDKTVRDETKLLVVEIYRWIGPAIKPQLTNLKPVQLTELEAEFEKLPPSKPVQSRFLRSQQDLKAKLLEQQAMAADSGDGQPVVEDTASSEAIDPYDLMDPVDILSKLPSDFYDKIEAKKWQDRREVLEALQKLAESPKLEQGDYGELVRALKKVVSKDSNVLLVGIGVKCIALLASGLRKKFNPHSVGCIEVLLEKFREKKAAVVQALREAVDAVFLTTTLEPISEACVASLDHKTPSVKAETALFLARCFAKCTPVTLPKKLLKLFVAALLKTVDDAAGEVREASFEALGTAMKVVSEKAMAPFVSDVDKIKMDKIKECCEKAVVFGKPAPAANQPAVIESAASKPATAGLQKPGPKINPGGGPPKPGSSSGSGGPPKKDAQPGVASGSSGVGAAGAAAKKKPVTGKGKKPDVKEEVMEKELSDEVVEEKMTQLVPAEILAKLGDANWKERLSAVERVTDALRALPRDDIPCQAVVRTVMKKPGLKDNNFQVLKLKVDLISHLALNSVFSKRSAEYCMTDLVDKIGDAKNGSSVQEALSCIAEATSLDYVALQALQLALEQKNPKNQSETFNWLATAVKQFGFKLTVKPVVDAVNKALAATNPGVRTSAVTLLGVMYMYMGPSLRVLFESEKPALLQTIDAEFEKVKGEKPPAPTRGLRKAGAGESEEVDGDEAGADEGAGGGEAVNVADLIPRTDISERLRDELLAEMGDKNWKVRKEGLDKVVAIMNEAKFITPNIGQLPEALKGRLTDSNKILAGIALSICQTLATAMGPNIKQHVRTLGPGIISNFGDSKPAMRQNAVQTLNAWIEQTGLAVFVEAELLVDSLKQENPNLRMELLGWLAEKLPTCKKLPPEFGECVPYLYACLEDRNADVRKKANEAVLPFMIHTGYDAMVRHASKVKPASKDAVMKALELARPNLPQKQAKPVASAPAAITSKQPPAVSKTAAAAAKVEAADDDDSVETSTTVSKSTTAVKGGAKGAKPASGGAASAAGAKKAGSAAGGSANSAATSKKKGQEEEDTSPPLKASNGKEQRFKDEKNLKVLKWNFSAPRPEFIEQLRLQMEPTFNKTLLDQMLHIDFKFHLKALDTLSKVCNDGSTGAEATVSNLDLILKWHTLRFFDTNTTVLMKQLEYLQLAFNMAANEGYHLHEYEAVSFIPYLVNKVGDPKDNIRKDVRSILQLLCKVHPPQKMFVYVIDGLKSKNAKQRTECLEELGCLIDSFGITVCQPSPAVALKQIAQQIGDRDNSVRSSALNTIVIAYSILGEAVYKHIGSLSDKDQSMLEERIKRSSKSVRSSVPAPSASGPVQSATTTRMSPDEKHQSKLSQLSKSQQPIASKTETKLVPAGGGQFRLDLDDNDLQDNYAMPQLIEPDLNEILNEPVKLPVTRMRPPSPAVKLLHTSTDAKSAVDLVVSQIASTDVQTSLQALHQIDEVLLDDEKSEAVVSHVDQLLITCTLQLRVTYSKHMSIHLDSSTRGLDAQHDVLRLYKCLLATLLSLCQRKNLIREATRDVLKDLVYHLITILLDTRLNELEDGQQVARSVNVTVVRLVEKADPTNVMSALIKLLHESLGTETYSTHFIELVMKCLWKMVRMLPGLVNELNIDRILADLHVFLKAFPSHTWKSRPSDMPLRTVKTILHTFVKIKGPRIVNHLTLIDRSDHQPSEVESYIRKLLRTMGSGSDSGSESVPAANLRNEQLSAGSDSHRSTSPKQEEIEKRSQRRISRSIHDTLADIFKKIGSKENTREGLNDLYDFKIQHPDADIEPFLKKSTQFFQDYIERGLKSVELERREKQKNTSVVTGQGQDPNQPTISSMSTTNSGSGAPAATCVTDVSAADYLERLKVLRARCGLDNSDVRVRSSDNAATTEFSAGVTKARSSATRTLDNALSSNNAAPLVTNANVESTVQPPSTTSASLSNIDDLKRRLEKIKNNVKDY